MTKPRNESVGGQDSGLPQPLHGLLDQPVRQLLQKLRPGEDYGTLIVPRSDEFPEPRLIVNAVGEVAVELLATLLSPEIPDPEDARAAAELFMFGSPFPEEI